MLEEFIMLIDKTLEWCLIIKIVIKHRFHHFTFPRPTIDGLSRGGHTPILQKSKLLKFYRLYVRVYRV